MKTFKLLLLVLLSVSIFAEDASTPKKVTSTLFENIKIFDGKSEQLKSGYDVLVKNNKIAQIAKGITADQNTTIIDAGGRVLMPGLIDAHTHLMVVDSPEKSIYTDTQTYIGALASQAAKEMLLRGFTTVRDAGGPVGGLKRAIDEGVISGPRIFPSNAFISQSGGHGDFDSSMSYLSPHFTGIANKAALFGWVNLADGVPEVQKAAREVLRSGASQIKVMLSGSIMGAHDPIDVTEYTYDELKAIVTEAEHWGTYVMVHAYSDEAVRMAIKAGVKSIEHGLMIKPETFQLIKEKGIWYSTQFLSYGKTPEEFGIQGTPAAPKLAAANAVADKAFKLAKKYGVKMSWGTDVFGSLELMAEQSKEFAARAKYFSNIEILRQVTSLNGELLALSNRRNPYPDAKLGLIEKGAYADIIIVEGNPLKDVTLLGKPAKNIKLIMKDGKVYKNTL